MDTVYQILLHTMWQGRDEISTKVYTVLNRYNDNLSIELRTDNTNLHSLWTWLYCHKRIRWCLLHRVCHFVLLLFRLALIPLAIFSGGTGDGSGEGTSNGTPCGSGAGGGAEVIAAILFSNSVIRSLVPLPPSSIACLNCSSVSLRRL